ncbi:primosomal protein N' [Chitinispirillales bacterium ANBcel5]|uniref:replication restart helicase PriA n=1 Tax=Cellulosispirillum alkaliphilum TaxID=3039283 RepID=UPI002A5173C1|nr:primosomal protein N' [Chitinispirillales bacterium ANBcel5]
MGVAFPVAIPGIYDYSIPEELSDRISYGTPVLVEVRRKRTWGVAVQLREKSHYPNLKPVLEIKSGRWTDSNQSLLKLYQWMASYYQCDVGRVFRPFLSKSIMKTREKTLNVYSVTQKAEDDLKERHREILQRMRQSKQPLTVKEITQLTGASYSVVKTLQNKGYLKQELASVLRHADELSMETSSEQIQLTAEQQAAVEQIGATLKNPGKPFLLYGITGSGKTHVYTELTKSALSMGKGVIILVPEISLTPQTIQRFRSAIGEAITVIHSHMSDGERRDSLQEVISGRKRVLLGVRSAILAPVDNVGLIIVDEEHDGSYKQSDMEPRYNARDVAVMRGHIQKCVVVLGSATPSTESFHNAGNGKYNLIRLSSRFGASRLPKVEIIDMGEEHKANNWTPFSRHLLEQVQTTISKGYQTILLLNRRGFSAVLMCKQCSYTYSCPNCSVNLRYHRAETAIKCHLCGYYAGAPDTCPKCGGENMKYKGTGIQKAEEALKEKFPEARIIRMDQDTTRKKGAHISILETFAKGEADILLGTQMVAKGLNFPNVTLVGVLQADTGLHFPDFRASERTFQLLTQVAGRAGRSETPGEVVIQTYFPDETAVKTARTHDYQTFFEGEIETRRTLLYPPFGKLARVVMEGKCEKNVIDCITTAADTLQRAEIPEVLLLGPSPAVLSKIDTIFRYSLLLKSSSVAKLSSALNLIRENQKTISGSTRCIIDVDPVNML